MGQWEREQMELDREYLTGEYERAKSMLEAFESHLDDDDSGIAMSSVRTSLLAKMHRAADELVRLNQAMRRRA